MAQTPWSGLLTGSSTPFLAAGDIVAFVDISDTTQSPGGSLVKGTLTEFFAQLPVPVAIKSASAIAFAVGLNGATNPALTVDASTALQVAGLKVTGAVTGGSVAVVVTDSGTDANLTLNAKGTGTIGIGSASTGRVTITPVTTIVGVLTLSATLAAASATFSGSATVGTVDGLVRPLLVQGADSSSTVIAKFARGAAEKPFYIAAAQNVESILASEGEIWLSTGITADTPFGSGTTSLKLSTTAAVFAVATTITTASATALAVGRQGATDPALLVDASTASSATGITVTAAAAGGGVTLAARSSGTNEALTINAKGSGQILVGAGSTGGVFFLSTSAATSYLSTSVYMPSGARVIRGAGTATFNVTRVNTSLGSPSAILSGDFIASYTGSGYDGTSLVSGASFDVLATENWAVGATGAKVSIGVTPNGTTGTQSAISVNSDLTTTFNSTAITPASDVSRAGFRLTVGTAPASPTDGDMWRTSASLFARIGSTTVDLPWRSILGGTLTSSTCAASTTAYIVMGAGTLGGTVENTRQWVMATACTLRNLYVVTNGAQPGDGAFVWTVRKNGVNTTITFTIAAGAAAGTFSDTTHSVSFAAGDLLSISAANASTSASATVNSWGLLGQPL